MACKSIYQQAQQVPLTLFPPTHFELVIADGRWEWSYSNILFSGLRILFIDVILATHTKEVKNFQRGKECLLNMTC